MLEEIIHTDLSEKFFSNLADFLRSYFQIEAEGLENIPTSGRGLIIPNHSGFAGTDAMMLSHLIHNHLGRSPKLLAHRAFFDWFDLVKRLSHSFGLEETNVPHGVKLLNDDKLVVIFPEGESGNFKSSLKRYQLQPFHTGFIRMAIQTRAPLIPCLVLGAEESHLNFGSINLSHYIAGLRVPVPVNLIPIPYPWKIRFLKPISLENIDVKDIEDRDLVRKLCSEIQNQMQTELNRELRKRASRRHVRRTRALIKLALN